ELELISQYSNGWSGSYSVSYQDAELDSGEQMPNYAQTMAKINLLSPLIANQLEVGLELNYEDGRRTLTGAETDSRVLSNITLSNNKLVKGLSLAASVYNLFDEDYSNPGFQEHQQNTLAQDGRTYRLKVNYKF
ncbi:MAG: TonB-dependent receptor, partial [Gammaproteobacteria bacterium]|nr:TonB-dependent receptor [Gammaproteobacteria bacterium]